MSMDSTQAIEQHLKTTLTAVQRLKSKGLHVRSVCLGRRRPTIHIERPYKPFPGSETALIEHSGNGRTECKVARFANCLVRWEESA